MCIICIAINCSIPSNSHYREVKFELNLYSTPPMKRINRGYFQQLEGRWRAGGGQVEGSWRAGGGQVEGSWRAAGGQLEGSWRAGGGQVEGRWRAGGGQVEGRWSDIQKGLPLVVVFNQLC